ncbi:hypothetical protein B0H10DRAFT_2051170 [Mycena sp. CBHHK59/15]|nr:hypothetical protein B0H10DRAFT_2051170 [Mycena sp. CBHHK59/15]
MPMGGMPYNKLFKNPNLDAYGMGSNWEDEETVLRRTRLLHATSSRLHPVSALFFMFFIAWALFDQTPPKKRSRELEMRSVHTGQYPDCVSSLWLLWLATGRMACPCRNGIRRAPKLLHLCTNSTWLSCSATALAMLAVLLPAGRG